MAKGLIASEQGKKKIHEAIEKRNWKKVDERFVIAASKLLEPKEDWKSLAKNSPGIHAPSVSPETLKKFVYAEDRIRAKIFEIFAQVLELNWRDLVDEPPSEDLIPVASTFYGRKEELKELEEWISSRQRLIILYGLGGIGKTSLATTVRDQVKKQFQKLLWQDFTYNQPVEVLLAELLDKLSPGSVGTLTSVEQRRSRLLTELHRNQILVVLDEQAASVDNQGSSNYRLRLEDYFKLWRELGIRTHQSTILLATRQKPVDVTALAEGGHGIQSLPLPGVDDQTGQKIQQSKGLTCDENSSRELTQRYGGNPLALKLVASIIHKYFNGDVAQFLKTSMVFPDTIETVLEQQIQFIEPLAEKLLMSLAKSDEPMTREELRENLQEFSSADFFKAMSALERRALLDKVSPENGQQPLYRLPPMVGEFVKRRSRPL